VGAGVATDVGTGVGVTVGVGDRVGEALASLDKTVGVDLGVASGDGEAATIPVKAIKLPNPIRSFFLRVILQSPYDCLNNALKA
jgi:hypothetical protein